MRRRRKAKVEGNETLTAVSGVKGEYMNKTEKQNLKAHR